ncbi:ATP-binding protein [Paracoccus tibetensis]|uniref:ATP-binding protein n=1 Tax=Paracoccus tibetensis TaxID=336292 RepID=UPI0015876364|nr:ATP-binding protein [Paracoccus tibetensis]
MAAELGEVGAAAERVRDLSIGEIGVEGGEALELAFVEAANNVIQHGGITAGEWLDIALRSDGAGVTLELQDQGHPIPAHVLDEASEPGDAFAESSRGLWLIQTLMDKVTYTSTSGINKLVLFRRR